MTRSKDAYQKEKRHYYISKAKDMDDYLLKTWGKPDLTIEPGDNTNWDSARMRYFQKHLKPGVVAVFARQGHTGIITKTYMDNSAPEVAGPVHIWLLRPK